MNKKMLTETKKLQAMQEYLKYDPALKSCFEQIANDPDGDCWFAPYICRIVLREMEKRRPEEDVNKKVVIFTDVEMDDYFNALATSALYYISDRNGEFVKANLVNYLVREFAKMMIKRDIIMDQKALEELDDELFGTGDIEKVYQSDAHDILCELLEDLPDTCKCVVLDIFGLVDQDPKSLAEIANMNNCSRSAVRQKLSAGLSGIRKNLATTKDIERVHILLDE